MARKRRSFLGRDDVMSVPDKLLEASLPEPYQPPAPNPKEEDEPINDTDLAFDVQLPESMDEQIPGFFDWDGGDGLEEPPTEEVPAPPIDSWTEDFPAPLGVPEAPLMEGILDGATPAPAGYQTPLPEESFDSFESLFNIPEPPKQPMKLGGLSVTRLLFFVMIAILLALPLSGGLAVFMFWNGLKGQKEAPPPPSSIPVHKELGRRPSPIAPTPVVTPTRVPATAAMGVSKGKAVTGDGSDSRLGTIKVRIKGTEQHVNIWVDGAFNGLAPINVALEPGSHRIAGVPVGQEDRKKVVDVDLSEGEVRSVDFTF